MSVYKLWHVAPIEKEMLWGSNKLAAWVTCSDGAIGSTPSALLWQLGQMLKPCREEWSTLKVRGCVPRYKT